MDKNKDEGLNKNTEEDKHEPSEIRKINEQLNKMIQSKNTMELFLNRMRNSAEVIRKINAVSNEMKKEKNEEKSKKEEGESEGEKSKDNYTSHEKVGNEVAESSESYTIVKSKEYKPVESIFGNNIKFNELINMYSADAVTKLNPGKEKRRLGDFLDNHLDNFLNETLDEFVQKSKDRRMWANRIWKFTIGLTMIVGLILVVNYLCSNLGFKKPFLNEKLVFVLIGGMFAQIISLMLIIMKYIFSPSKDAYAYLTELVKVRKLKDGHDFLEETGPGVQVNLENLKE